MPNFFVDVHQNLVYEASWPSRPIRPILNEPEALIPPNLDVFRVLYQTIFRVIQISTSKIQNIFVDVRQYLAYASSWPSRQPVGHHGQSNSFSRTNEPRSAHTPISMIFVCYSKPFFGLSRLRRQKAKFFCGCSSRPCLCSRLAIMSNLTYLQGQKSPEASIPLISTIFVCYSKQFIGLRRQKFKIFCGRPSRPCLCIRLALTASTTNFEGQTCPEAANPSFRRFSCAIVNHFWVIQNKTSKIPKIFVDVRQDLGYASSWPSRLVRPIFKVKQSSKRAYPTIVTNFGDPNSDVKKANFFVDVLQDLVYAAGWPSQSIQLIFKVKRAPNQANLSFRRFSCAIANLFLGDLDFDVKNAKFFYERPSRPCLCSLLASTSNSTHFQGQTSPEEGIPQFRRFS
uniref:Uncharacterized protein n=1 Tax=Solanum lycopersicum TaxID=4081 RepID=A0A3Q7HDN9_SOLLC